METIGDRIKAKRKELGLTQLALAEKLNVTDRAVSKWEQNEGNPDFSLLPILAETLGVTLDYLITGKIDAPQINLEDMDKTKRAILLAEKDDVEDFIKYGYVSETILYDNATKGKITRSSIDFKLEEGVRKAIYEKKSRKIFNVVLDAFLTMKICKSWNLLQYEISPASLVYDDINDFISMCVLCGRKDALDVLGVKWFAIGTPSFNANRRINSSSNNRPSMNFTNIVRPESTYLISSETFSGCFAPNVSEDIIDYFCDFLYQERIRIGGQFRPRVNFLICETISELYKTKRFDRLHSVMDKLNENLEKCSEIWKSLKSDHYRHPKIDGSFILDGETPASCPPWYQYPNVQGIVPTISISEVKACMDIEWLRKFNDYNKKWSQYFGDGKTGYMTEEDIQVYLVQFDTNVSDDDKTIAENTRMRLLNYKGVNMPFVGTDDVDKLKKSISEAKRIYDHILSKGFIHYMELVETYVGEKDYKALFEFANDCELKSLEDAALGMNDDEIIDAAASLFLPPEKIVTQYLEMQNVLLAAGEGNGYIHFNHFAYSRSDFQKKMDEILLRYNKEISGRNDKLSRMIERQNNIIPLRDYLLKAVELKVEDLKELPFAKYCQELKLCIYQAYVAKTEGRIESITREKERKAEYDAVASEITVDYLRTESQKGNMENAIIKLCVLLEAKLKYCCRYEGDLFNMIDTFVTVKYTPGELHNCWDDEDNNYYTYQREDEETKKENERKAHKTQLLHKLRMKRNQLVHAGGGKTDFSKDDLDECIAIVEAI